MFICFCLITNIPANLNHDFQWKKFKETKLKFCKCIFSMMPQFFIHHQTDLAQQHGLKIQLTQISPDCYLKTFIADYAENYMHLAQDNIVH